MSGDDLMNMYKRGYTPRDLKGEFFTGHHHKQQYGRKPGAFMAEIPLAKKYIIQTVI